MKVTVAITRKEFPPHNGRFVYVKHWSVRRMVIANVPHVDLSVVRQGGPALVVRMELDAARHLVQELERVVCEVTGETSLF